MERGAGVVETPREKRNREFLQYRSAHPGVTYAQWLNGAAIDYVKRGAKHATLGGNLGYENWWDAGRSTVERYMRLFPFTPTSRVIDYGCGSLRVGGHFIRYLDAGCYFGIDVTMGLIEVGRDLVGAELLDEKKPQFGPIDEPTMERAARFNADIVFSTAVCYHVFPDEAPIYFGNLKRLAHKPGATLFFDVSVSDEPVLEHALSAPVEYYTKALAPLELVQLHAIATRTEQKQTLGILEFRTPEPPPRRWWQRK